MNKAHCYNRILRPNQSHETLLKQLLTWRHYLQIKVITNRPAETTTLNHIGGWAKIATMILLE